MQEEEDVKELVCVIGHELASLEEGIRTGVKPLIQCLRLVDLIQRLGIDRYFQEHIKRIIKTTYIKWDESYGLDDADASVVAFRLLRLQGYNVSTDFLEKLQDKNGNFTCFFVEKPTQILGMLNLYKCSQICFPFERAVMEKAMVYASSHLNKALLAKEQSILQTNNSSFEVKFALDYPRIYNLPRLESRSIIRQFCPTNLYERKCLSLARKDLEILQVHHIREMDKINIWWEKQGVKDLSFSRGQVQKCFFTISSTIFEQQFSAFRTIFTKSACITVLIDDLFDDPASELDGISLFVEAVRSWDPSGLRKFHDCKAVFASLHSTMIETAKEASNAQGRDLVPFFKLVWEETISALFKEAEWRHSQYIPPLEEYLENGAISIAPTTCFLTSMFLMGEPIKDNVMQKVGLRSRCMYLVGLISRLANDIATFRREAIAGEATSAVSCYIQDNPWCTEEEAISALEQMMESACVELEWELFSTRSSVPECCSRAILSFARIMRLVYRRADAFSNSSDMEFEELCRDYMYGSLA